MGEFVLVITGGVLAIVGGLLGAWYQAEVATRAAKGDRLRDIYHPILAAAEKARFFARIHLDALFDESGTMHPNLRKAERKQVRDVLEHLSAAQESASWLAFESDKPSAHVRRTFATLHALMFLYQQRLDESRQPNGAIDRDTSKAEKLKIKQTCDGLEVFVRGHIIELERSPARQVRIRFQRRTAKIQRRRKYLWLRTRLTFAHWAKRVRSTF